MSLQKKCQHPKTKQLHCKCAWYNVYRENGKQQYKPLGNDYHEALRLYQMDTRGQTDWIDKRFKAVSKRWLASIEHEVRRQTHKNYRTCLVRANEIIGHLPVGMVSAGTITELQTTLADKGYSRGYIKTIRIAVVSVLRYAEDLKLIKTAPQLRKQKASTSLSVKKHLTPGEFTSVLTALPDDLQSIAPLLRFTYLTGLRPCEVLALTPAAVNLERKTLLVYCQMDTANNIVLPYTKTLSSRRTVDLTSVAIEQLPSTNSPDDRYWPMPYTTVARYWREAVKAAGLPRMGLHSLRHSNASLRFAKGQPIPYVAAQLGHANPNVTLHTYAHFIEIPTRDADELDAMFESLL